ncbi:MAG: hypothetical protein FD144_4772 [Rhodospirillaceae bacterium]|nr:MAG: hypothetical protein FD144_4772 [Rhodospirillaceae bacterium]
MRVKMRTLYASASGTVLPGAIADVSDEEGRDLLAGRFAEEVEQATEPAAEEPTVAAPEASTAGPPEHAGGAKSRGWRRGR